MSRLLEIWNLSLVLYSMFILQLHRRVSFFSSICTTYMHVITNRALLCNCHEVSKVSSEAIGNILDGDHRESGREVFSTFFQVSFIYETFAFICINKLAGPLKSLHRVAFLRKQLQVKR